MLEVNKTTPLVLEQKSEAHQELTGSQLRTAEKLIKEKILWLVPNWGCNRNCATCFAADVMEDAKRHDYQKARLDFFAKAQALSELPWREIIITGGEPMEDRSLLTATLEVINPKLPVRIITNGDWIMQENERNHVIGIVNDSKREIQIDISAHDSALRFEEKIDTLIDAIAVQYPKKSKISIGAQLRRQEGKLDDYFRKINNLSLWRPDVEIEEHDVLELGNASIRKGQGQPVTIELAKFLKYSDRLTSLGVHLVPGKEGSRVIANHQAPYLTSEMTPADIVSPIDSPAAVVRKVLGFYALPDKKNRKETIEAFKSAAAKAGVCLYDNLWLYQASNK